MPRHQHALDNAGRPPRSGPATVHSRGHRSISSHRRGTSRRATLPARRRLGIVLTDAEPRQRRRERAICIRPVGCGDECCLMQPPPPGDIPDRPLKPVGRPPGRAGTCVAAGPAWTGPAVSRAAPIRCARRSSRARRRSPLPVSRGPTWARDRCACSSKDRACARRACRSGRGGRGSPIHRCPASVGLDGLSGAFAWIRDRPDGFLKAVVTM